MTALNKQELKPGLYAILFRNNWDGEGDTYETLATLDSNHIWHNHETGRELFEYEGDAVLKAWLLNDCTTTDALEAAEKRIAELESNEIRDDGNQFLVVRHPGKTPVIKHWSGDPEEFLRNLIEQDPLVTIDIITHRYYGVGGQWVQDADEYLHMMAAAGIGVKER